MFATSAMRYIRVTPGCGYGIALNVDCKTMRLPRPFLILSHFPYFCNTRVHLLALTTGACYLFPPPSPCVCTQHISYCVNFFLFSSSFIPAPVSRFARTYRNDLSLHSNPNFRKKKRKKRKRSTTATELNLGSTVRDLFYPPLH